MEIRPAESRDVAVAGGTLHAGCWTGPGPTVLAVHGITANHLSWLAVAAAVPQLTVLAPDLRGRGASADLPGPYGFAAHVADLVAVLDAYGLDRVVVAGHSMGAFVAVALAGRHPERVSRLVLVDGGLPLGEPAAPGTPAPDIQAALGPAGARLAMTFPSADAYRQFWREHPAFGPMWGPAVQAYLDYDLVGEPPRLRSSCRAAAVAVDGAELVDHAATAAALRRVEVPVTFLRAERGLLDAPPALYPEAAAARWFADRRQVRDVSVSDTNHYSILLAPPAAAAVGAAITAAVDDCLPAS